MSHYIAMWSGPRNLSTALMRSFENRLDCFVSDEPFYAHFLKNNDIDHPFRNEILKKYDNNWKNILTALKSKIRAEIKCPVYSNWDNESKANQFIRIIIIIYTMNIIVI